MRISATSIITAAVITALAAPAAFGQIDRVLRYTQAKTDQDMQEIATSIGAVTDIRTIVVDRGQRSLTVQGTAGQIALAEWLFAALDQPAGASSSLREFRMEGGDEALVRVYYLPRLESIQELQEMATLVRSMAGIRRLFTCTAPRAIVIRSSDEPAALAEWMIHELQANRDAVAQPDNPAAHEFRVAAGGDDVVRVFYLKSGDTMQRFQQIVTQVRTATGMKRVFTYGWPRAAAFRGTAAQLAQAEGLIQKLDQ